LENEVVDRHQWIRNQERSLCDRDHRLETIGYILNQKIDLMDNLKIEIERLKSLPDPVEKVSEAPKELPTL
jgi:hypothetical protein